MWQNIEHDGYIHTVPIQDTHNHLASKECWCQPEVEEEFKLIVHHSADGREQFETGERKPS